MGNIACRKNHKLTSHPVTTEWLDETVDMQDEILID